MRNINKKINCGVLYGVGIGPGDPELLTIKAQRILRSVPVIFAPKADSESSSIAAEIIKSHIPNKRKIKQLVFPMTRDRKILRAFWEQAATSVYKVLSSGKDTAFITLGDPFIYSTYSYLLTAIKKLDSNVTTVTVPGISSINAASSLLEIPLVEASEKYLVMPLPKNFAEIKKALALVDSLVILKIGKNLDKLLKFLKREKLNKTSYFVQRIGLPGQHITKDISLLSDTASGYLSMMIIKWVPQ
jgi:precorrin-2/cobalt-factor-2 C20-methyltransferase